MKMPVSWYEENITNMRKYLVSEYEKFEKLGLELERIAQRISILQAKIDRAKTEGKDSFDEDKYNVPMVYRKTSRNSLSNE